MSARDTAVYWAGLRRAGMRTNDRGWWLRLGAHSGMRTAECDGGFPMRWANYQQTDRNRATMRDGGQQQRKRAGCCVRRQCVTQSVSTAPGNRLKDCTRREECTAVRCCQRAPGSDRRRSGGEQPRGVSKVGSAANKPGSGNGDGWAKAGRGRAAIEAETTRRSAVNPA